MYEHILVTGGAGFAGSHAAIRLKREFPGTRVTAFDNLRRRGSELNLPRLAAAGVEFAHGDVRSAADLEALPPPGLIVEASAEPSAQAGYGGSPQYLIETNLNGLFPLPGTGAAAWGGFPADLHQPRLSRARAQRPGVARGGDALHAARWPGRCGRIRRGHKRGFPAGGRAIPLWHDEAGSGADDHRVRRRLWAAYRHRPLRADCRPLADGKDGPGRGGAVGGGPRFWPAFALYRVRRRRQAGAGYPARG